MFRILLVDDSPRMKTMSDEFWHGTDYSPQLVQVSTMQAAIEMSARSPFWYIDVNADTVDYIPQLQLLRSVTAAPIITLTSNFNSKALVDALFFHERTERDYAAEIGISHQAVGKRKKKIIDKLRGLMGAEEK